MMSASVKPPTSTFVAIDINDDGADSDENPSYNSPAGQPSNSLRDQSRRLSTTLKRRAEHYDIASPPEPEPASPTPSAGAESSGWNYWWQEVGSAKVHGGDYQTRHRTALRSALGSLALFSALVLPNQKVLAGAWIGNIFLQTTLKDSFGATFISAKSFSKSIVLTTMLSTGIAFFMESLEETPASVVLPFLVMLLTFFIMTCPQIESRNLMVIVMYIAVAAPVRKSVMWWKPFGYMGTYILGLSIALLVSVFNLALHSIHVLLERQEKDLTMLLMKCKEYADNTGATPGVARAAMATIEMLCNRIMATTKTLKSKLPAANVELTLRCRGKAARDLGQWVKHSEQLLTSLKNIRASLTQRVIGEEYSAYSEQLRQTKADLVEEVGPARNRMIDSYIAAVAVCHAWANPSAHRTVLPDVERELEAAIAECRKEFNASMNRAALRLTNDQSNTPIFAHLTRRMTAFQALFELGDSLLIYLHEHSWEAEDVFDSDESNARHRSVYSHLCGMLGSFVNWVELRWLWHNPDTLRLAFKTSIGMFLASLFVSVPYLWEISKPFGVWPGLTIASVNLTNTGSSFSKAADRLFGTLLAAAFALLVSDLFPGSDKDYVKLPAMAFFTYFVIYLRNNDHAYKYTYAATSIGAMIYGSAKSNLNISTYVPKRIELIFVGVVVFSFVELFLFPRSSRRLVEEYSLKSLMSLRDFLQQATHCKRRMENHLTQAASAGWAEEFDKIFFDGANDPYDLDRLTARHEELKRNTSKVKKEIDAALDEPNMGLSINLHPAGFRGLSRELIECEIQALLLLKSLRELAGFYQQKGHPIRNMNFARLHARFLEEVAAEAVGACKWLESAFPDRRMRPQGGNGIKSVTAAASFRQIEEVRLHIIADWSRHHHLNADEERGNPADSVAAMSLGITTNYILGLCHHFQKAGRHVESIVQSFPASK